MSVVVQWKGGGDAQVVETDGHNVVLRSSRSAAPGTPLSADTALAGGVLVQVKVFGCTRQPDGAFVIRGRWINLTKQVREALLAQM